jgi:hypothetical protein
MKRQDFNRDINEKWAWPRKTWLQQRLEAVKADKQRDHQKGRDTTDKPAALQARGKKTDKE